MTLEQQVCSLDFAKRLKQLGATQDSLYYWSDQLNRLLTRDDFLAYDPYNQDLLQDDGFREAVDRTYSAFTVAELGEMLPANTLHYSKDGDQWCVLYGPNLQEGHGEFAGTEADGRAKMLIYLLENRITSLSEAA